MHTGRVQKNPQGFAFILSAGIPDTYVDRDSAQFLLTRDLVSFTVVSDGRRKSARIHQVLERGVLSVYGCFRKLPSPHVVTAAGEAFHADAGREVQDGSYVIATIVCYPTHSKAALVKVAHDLGPAPKPADDNLIALTVLGLPTEFPLDVRLEARTEPPDDTTRVDLTGLDFVTIDGEDAKDFDDAVFVQAQSGDEAWVLYVAIADVSHFVRPDTALDLEARRRSTSVYLPGTCIPMLPEILSNDRCSLNPQSPKKVVVAKMAFDRHGVRTRSDFFSATIQTRMRLTYSQVHAHFAGESRPELSALKTPLDHARRLYRNMRERRKERFALDFNFPELKFDLDAFATPRSIYFAPHFESHELIEEFMVAANSAVAERLRHERVLFRVHEAPDTDELTDLNTLLKSLGVSHRVTSFTHEAIAELLQIDNPVLHRALLRMQRQARYGFDPLGHFGLALKDYLHFTSPIRRYPDLVAHRALKSVIENRKSADNETGDSPYDLARETSDKERRAMEAERFVSRRKQCWFMHPLVGEEFNGRVSDFSKTGIGVRLDNGIDGFLPISFELDEKRLRARLGGEFISLGSPIVVRVNRVDVEMGRIELGI